MIEGNEKILEDLIQRATIRAITEQTDLAVIYEDKGNGAALLVKQEDLDHFLEDPKYFHLCSISSLGEVKEP